MMAKWLRRSSWMVLVAAAIAAMGCKDSPSRQATKEAQKAEQFAIGKLNELVAALASDTLTPESRDALVSQSLDAAEKKLQDEIRKNPDYWPLQEYLGVVLSEKGGYWALRTQEMMAQARQDLNRALLTANHVNELQLLIDQWHKRVKVYEAARQKLDDDQAALEKERTACLQEVAKLNKQHSDLAGEAKSKRDKAQADRAEAIKLVDTLDRHSENFARMPANLQEEHLDKLSKALQKKADAEKLMSEAIERDSQADILASQVQREELKSAMIAARIDLIKKSREGFVGLMAGAGQPLAGTTQAGLTGGDPGLDRKCAELRSAVVTQLKTVQPVLENTDAAAKKALAAYDAGIVQLIGALGRVEQLNRQLRAQPAEQTSPDNLSEVTVGLELASAHAGLGQLRLTLADNARIFEDARRLLTMLGQPVPSNLPTVSAGEMRAAGKQSLEAALQTLEKTSANPMAKQDVRWIRRFQDYREFLQKTSQGIGGTAAPVAPSTP